MVKVGKKNCWMCTTQRQQKMATESKALVKNTGHILTPPFVVTLKIQKHLITEVIKYIEICHDKKKKIFMRKLLHDLCTKNVWKKVMNYIRRELLQVIRQNILMLKN